MKRCLQSLIMVLGCFAAAGTRAELQMGGGLEYFRWEENTAPVVKETGPILGFHVSYLADKRDGWLLGVQGRAWAGTVDYEGSLLATNEPVSGDTDYFGIGAEGQLRYRGVSGGQRFDGILGLGAESWNRQLTRDQSEQYTVLSVRLAFEVAPDQKRRGLLAGLGVEYPFYIYEDANFDEIGANNNPTLRPKGRVGFDAHLGVQIDAKWRVVGYYQLLRMKASDPKFVSFPNGHALASGDYFQPDSDMSIIGVRFEYRIQ